MNEKIDGKMQYFFFIIHLLFYIIYIIFNNLINVCKELISTWITFIIEFLIFLIAEALFWKNMRNIGPIWLLRRRIEFPYSYSFQTILLSRKYASWFTNGWKEVATRRWKLSRISQNENVHILCIILHVDLFFYKKIFIRWF